MDPVPLDQLERELHRELTSPTLAARFSDWSRGEPALARFHNPSELLRFLRSRPSPAERDAVLRPLVARAPRDAVARRLVLHAIFPGLKNIARRSLIDVDEREELWANLLCCAWEEIGSYSIRRRPRRIAANLLLDSMRSALRAMRRDHLPEVPVAELYSTALRIKEAGDVDALFARAVAASAISRTEADLILSTRFDGIPLAHIADASGEPYNRVKVRRQRAERRLLVWLGYPPVPRGNQKRPFSCARVAGAGPSGQVGA